MTDDATPTCRGVGRGEAVHARDLLPLVYSQLRHLAARQLDGEQPGQTLQPTALVHEAYLRLIGPEGVGGDWQGRAHFYAAAAEAMRRILVDNARRKHAEKHGGGRRREALSDGLAADPAAARTSEDLVAIDCALTKLQREDPAKADLVKVHFFAGLSLEDAAAALGISRATAYRHWRYARAWLHREIAGGGTSDER